MSVDELRSQITEELSKLDETKSKLEKLSKKRKLQESKYESMLKYLKSAHDAKTSQTKQEHADLKQKTDRLELLDHIRTAEKPVVLIHEGVFDDILSVDDYKVLKAEYIGSLVIRGRSKRAVCKNDRIIGGKGYDCDYYINWDRTRVIMKDGKEMDGWKIPEMNTDYLQREIEDEGNEWVDLLDYVDCDGDHHGVYALAEAKKDLIAVSWKE